MDIIIEAGLEGPTEGASEVRFFAEGYWLGTDSSSPYSFLWRTPAIANFALTAVAFTIDGGVTSAPVFISVTNNFPPLISITNPTPGTLFLPGPNIWLQADGFDRDGIISSVEFFANGRRIGEAAPVSDSSFGLIWSNPLCGDYALQAIATDNLGAQGFSEFSVIRVSPSTNRPPPIIRGPYLQKASASATTINWRTTIANDSRVAYGTDPDHLDLLRTDSANTLDHSVTLSGLSPGTRYFYAVGSSEGVLTAWPDQFFVTGPTSPRPTRIWVLGDSGSANAPARAVRDAYYAFADRETDLCLMLGDNAYEFGADGDYQAAVFDMYPATLRQTVLWPSVGNHDVDPAYLRIFTLPTAGESGGAASGTESYYSFDYGNVHFICLNSFRENRLPSGPMLTWLRSDLARAAKDWIIAFWHHPPYSHGSHNSDLETEQVQMRLYALPILEEYGTDLVLCGHSHSYERSFLLNGHYGSSSTLSSEMILNSGDGRTNGSGAYLKPAERLGAHRGTVYVVAGSASQFGGGSLDHPAMFTSLNQYGSLILDIDRLRLDAKFLAANGDINDYFTIEKRDVPSLRIERRDSEMVLSWSNTSSPVALESTDTFDLPTQWASVTNPPVVSSDRSEVVLDKQNPSGFFRLRSSP